MLASGPAGWEGRGFQKTFKVSKKVFPKDSTSLRASRWLAVAASKRKRGDVHCAAWPPDPQSCKISYSKRSIFTKPFFCIHKWLGYLLWTPGRHPDEARRRNCTPQKKLEISKLRKKSFLKLQRDPRLLPRWPQARFTSFSQGFWRRLESLHIHSAKRLEDS